jgi:two-component sensor histidine kinase
MVDNVVLDHCGLGKEDKAFLQELSANLPILADLSRADLLLYCKSATARAVVVAQAMPHSVTPLYREDYVGRWATSADQSEVLRALGGRGSARTVYTVVIRGATVARQVFTVRRGKGPIIAALISDSYWLAYERHLRRSKVFQSALDNFRTTVLRGALKGASSLTPFGEHDGIMYVGADRRIRYMSGVASGLYRLLGYRDSLDGWRVSDLETVDHQMVTQALGELHCLERCDEQYGRTWIRRALPILVPTNTWISELAGQLAPGSALPLESKGVFVLIHDATEALQAQRELESQMSLLREVHHRVKNNLQVIASLMRMQARRAESEESRHLLQESINRVLSVAVVHEFLSQNAKGTINLQEVAHRILAQMQQGLIDPDKRIALRAKGPDIWLPSERATQCALVINELVQNAIQHGMERREEGWVEVELVDQGDQVTIMVTDNGEGLPEGFDLTTNSNLGLRIVRSMVERDLRGTFDLVGNHLTQAIIRFDKSVLGGD